MSGEGKQRKGKDRRVRKDLELLLQRRKRFMLPEGSARTATPIERVQRTGVEIGRLRREGMDGRMRLKCEGIGGKLARRSRSESLMVVERGGLVVRRRRSGIEVIMRGELFRKDVAKRGRSLVERFLSTSIELVVRLRGRSSSMEGLIEAGEVVEAGKIARAA